MISNDRFGFIAWAVEEKCAELRRGLWLVLCPGRGDLFFEKDIVLGCFILH
jgi:hypothetical protein